MEWQLAFDRRGSFLESLASPQMSYSWGYAAAAADGAGTSSNRKAAGSTSNSSTSSGSGSGGGYFGTAGVCWASDDAGCPRVMQLDDEEALLLSTWVRTGTWVLPRVAAHLHIAAVAAPAQKGTAKAAKAQGGSTAWVELRLRGGGQVGRGRASASAPGCCFRRFLLTRLLLASLDQPLAGGLNPWRGPRPCRWLSGWSCARPAGCRAACACAWQETRRCGSSATGESGSQACGWRAPPRRAAARRAA